MEVIYEPNKNRIINNCIAAFDNPKIIIVDSQSAGYKAVRDKQDNKLISKLQINQVDDAAYYYEISKDF